MSGNPILKTVQRAWALVVIALTTLLLVTALAGLAYSREDRVAICHMPGTPDEETLRVAERAVTAHLRHGDYEGMCDVCTTLRGSGVLNPDLEFEGLKFSGDEHVEYFTVMSGRTEPYHIVAAIGDVRASFDAETGPGDSTMLLHMPGDKCPADCGEQADPSCRCFRAVETWPTEPVDLSFRAPGASAPPDWSIRCAHEPS